MRRYDEERGRDRRRAKAMVTRRARRSKGGVVRS